MDIYDVILGILGLCVGQIVGHIFIYRFLHPYVVVPYLKKRKMRLDRQVDDKGE